jgi:hypothetical protein
LLAYQGIYEDRANSPVMPRQPDDRIGKYVPEEMAVVKLRQPVRSVFKLFAEAVSPQLFVPRGRAIIIAFE